MGRWGFNAGSVYLGDQKVAVRVPRLRSAGGEIALESYRRFQEPQTLDEITLRRVLQGVSQRRYEEAAPFSTLPSK